MLDCALVSADEGFRHAVLGIIRQPAAQARVSVDLQTTADRMDSGNLRKILDAAPKVVFLDLGQNPSGVQGIQALSQEAPEMPLIVAGPALSADGLLAVMRSGAAEYLPRPLSHEETLAAFLRVRRRVASTHAGASKDLGRVITIFSAKGGTGVTTVATNLAVAVRALTNKDVLLLDLAPSLGTASVAMGVQARYTYLDVIRNFHRLDEELFRSFLEVNESGVHILASPLTLMDLDPPAGEDLQGLVVLCKQYFDFVVIDGGSSVSSQLFRTLRDSDDRMLVVTPELPSLRNLKQAMDLFGQGNGKGPPKVLLNQYKEGAGLSAGDVEDGLGYRVAAILERDEARVPQSVNLGRPEVLSGRSKFARSLMDLGTELVGPDQVIKTKKGFLNRLFKSSKDTQKSGKETK